jgi:hypothetical protein
MWRFLRSCRPLAVPIVGALILIAWGLMNLFDERFASRRLPEMGVVCVGAFILLFCLFLAWLFPGDSDHNP